MKEWGRAQGERGGISFPLQQIFYYSTFVPEEEVISSSVL